MGRQNYLRNSGIQLVLLLLVGLTLRSIYSDVTYFRNEWEFKKYIQSLNVNSYRSGYWSNKPSDAGPCEPSDDRPCERQDQVHTTSTGEFLFEHLSEKTNTNRPVQSER